MDAASTPPSPETKYYTKFVFVKENITRLRDALAAIQRFSSSVLQLSEVMPQFCATCIIDASPSSPCSHACANQFLLTAYGVQLSLVFDVHANACFVTSKQPPTRTDWKYFHCPLKASGALTPTPTNNNNVTLIALSPPEAYALSLFSLFLNAVIGGCMYLKTFNANNERVRFPTDVYASQNAHRDNFQMVASGVQSTLPEELNMPAHKRLRTENLAPIPETSAPSIDVPLQSNELIEIINGDVTTTESSLMTMSTSLHEAANAVAESIFHVRMASELYASGAAKLAWLAKARNDASSRKLWRTWLNDLSSTATRLSAVKQKLDGFHKCLVADMENLSSSFQDSDAQPPLSLFEDPPQHVPRVVDTWWQEFGNTETVLLQTPVPVRAVPATTIMDM